MCEVTQYIVGNCPIQAIDKCCSLASGLLARDISLKQASADLIKSTYEKKISLVDIGGEKYLISEYNKTEDGNYYDIYRGKIFSYDFAEGTGNIVGDYTKDEVQEKYFDRVKSVFEGSYKEGSFLIAKENNIVFFLLVGQHSAPDGSTFGDIVARYDVEGLSIKAHAKLHLQGVSLSPDTAHFDFAIEEQLTSQSPLPRFIAGAISNFERKISESVRMYISVYEEHVLSVLRRKVSLTKNDIRW